MGPFGEFHFGNPHGFYPVHSLGINRAIERVFVALDFFQRGVDLLQGGVIESSARLANMNEFLMLVIKPKHQRTKILARALGIGIAANHAIHGLRDLDLQPFRCAAFLVATVSFFGKNAFQSLLLCHFE